jgi:indole-3-glycerol phosphate synthase
MTASILQKIVEVKKRDVKAAKADMPLEALKERAAQYKPLNFAEALRGTEMKLIAEVKKASPSRGVLVIDFDPVTIASTYANCGAAAISVLTETPHFQGSPEHLEQIREKVSLPLLRKDFIFDEYQVYESAAIGADAMLLIAAILSARQLNKLLDLAHQLGLSCLVETHDKKDIIKAIKSGAEIIGINNRDLNTFKTDIETTHELREFIPSDKFLVSESGIQSAEDIKRLKTWGVNAVLIGEALLTATDIQTTIKRLMS